MGKVGNLIGDILNLFGKNNAITLNVLLIVTCLSAGGIIVLTFDSSLFKDLEFLNIVFLCGIIGIFLIILAFGVIFGFSTLPKYLSSRENSLYFSIITTWISVVMLMIVKLLVEEMKFVSFGTLAVILITDIALNLLLWSVYFIGSYGTRKKRKIKKKGFRKN